MNLILNQGFINTIANSQDPAVQHALVALQALDFDQDPQNRIAAIAGLDMDVAFPAQQPALANRAEIIQELPAILLLVQAAEQRALESLNAAVQVGFDARLAACQQALADANIIDAPGSADFQGRLQAEIAALQAIEALGQEPDLAQRLADARFIHIAQFLQRAQEYNAKLQHEINVLAAINDLSTDPIPDRLINAQAILNDIQQQNGQYAQAPNIAEYDAKLQHEINVLQRVNGVVFHQRDKVQALVEMQAILQDIHLYAQAPNIMQYTNNMQTMEAAFRQFITTDQFNDPGTTWVHLAGRFTDRDPVNIQLDLGNPMSNDIYDELLTEKALEIVGAINAADPNQAARTQAIADARAAIANIPAAFPHKAHLEAAIEAKRVLAAATHPDVDAIRNMTSSQRAQVSVEARTEAAKRRGAL